MVHCVETRFYIPEIQVGLHTRICHEFYAC